MFFFQLDPRSDRELNLVLQDWLISNINKIYITL